MYRYMRKPVLYTKDNFFFFLKLYKEKEREKNKQIDKYKSEKIKLKTLINK